MSSRDEDILSAELRGSTAEFLGWLTGLLPPSDRESIPPEMRPAFDKMLGRIVAAAKRYSESGDHVLVPTEPTPEMRIAGGIAWSEAEATAETYVDTADACYKAMLAARPTSAPSPAERESP